MDSRFLGHIKAFIFLVMFLTVLVYVHSGILIIISAWAPLTLLTWDCSQQWRLTGVPLNEPLPRHTMKGVDWHRAGLSRDSDMHSLELKLQYGSWKVIGQGTWHRRSGTKLMQYYTVYGSTSTSTNHFQIFTGHKLRLWKALKWKYFQVLTELSESAT